MDTDTELVVVTGSAPIASHVRDALPEGATVIAVDGGLDHALAAGLAPEVLVGDLDSVSSDGLAWAESNAAVERHPADKDRTDTELALAHAVDRRPERLVVVGGGDRLDHSLAAIGALCARSMTSVPVLEAWWDGHHLDVVHGPGRRRLHLVPGSTISLLVLGRPCERVTIDGVRWPLHDHHLEPVVGHGVSNEVAADDGLVTVSVSSGVLVVFDEPVPPARSAPTSRSTRRTT